MVLRRSGDKALQMRRSNYTSYVGYPRVCGGTALTYAWPCCRIGLTATTLEECLGSVLCEVPDQEGDEQPTDDHDEEWAPGHSGCMPSLLH